MTSKSYPNVQCTVETRCPMQRQNETSNAPSRRGVQFTVEISSRSEKTEIEYIWSVQMTAATSCTSGTRNRKFSVESDNPNHTGRIKTPKLPDYSTLQNTWSDFELEYYAESMFSRD
jgi:hypothetical protein